MTERVLGPSGSKRRKRFLLLPILAASLLALFWIGGAQAVHNVGVFQLDKDASTATPSGAVGEDWDLICKANPSTCTFAAGYGSPSGTTTANPSSFSKDPSESDTDDILKGGTKDDNNIPSWKWASAKPSPPKNDITDAYAAEYVCNTATCTSQNIAGHKLLYFGGDRFSNDGTANIAFWFFQKRITQRLADGTTDAGPGDVCTLGAGCNFGGTHTEGNVSLGGPNGTGCSTTNVCTPGDILIISAFGPKAAINVYEWVGAGKGFGFDNKGNKTPGKNCFTGACSLQPLLVGSAACEDQPVGGADAACAAVNSDVTPSPWEVNQKNAASNSFQPTNFFEGGIDLTALKVDACFSSFLLNTRASAAGDAELHDKVLGQFTRCVPGMTTDATTTANQIVAPGTSVNDVATITVTGGTNAPDPAGTVTFRLCFNATTNPSCPSGGGISAGSGTLGNQPGGTTTDGIAIATSSPAVAPTTPGFYCFRADWPGDSNYPTALSAVDTGDGLECFRVRDTSTTTTAQNWLPNDTATVKNSSGGAASGSVTFTLYKNGDCTAGTGDVDVLHVFGPTTLDGSGQATTGNTTFGIAVSTGRTISWRVTYTPSDPNAITGSTSHCETSTVSINDDLGS